MNVFRISFTFSGSGRSLSSIVLMVTMILFFTSCAANNPFEINLMPAPDIYEKGNIEPFTDTNPVDSIPYSGMLYATDRKPAADGRNNYLDTRGNELRLGVAEIELGDENITWEEARRISLLKNRTEKYPLKVTAAKEIGVLDRSVSVFTPTEMIPDPPDAPAKTFAAKINTKLAMSENKSIFIYVHGYKVVFENPILVATELWHFLGYEGVFIAFSWPSTPATLAYTSDLETAALSSHNLRVLIDYLAEETDAERIHIVGYSAGTRLVINALSQLTFIHFNDDNASIRKKYRLGHIILVGSDFDRHLFGAYLHEGLMKVPETVSVYLSGKDKALGVSSWLFGRQRLGQKWTENLDPQVAGYLRRTPALRFIDVTDAAGAKAGNGHAYFRNSPWASSDILMTLMFDLQPEERGLVQDPETLIWTFPVDYIQRLRDALRQYRPETEKARPQG